MNVMYLIKVCFLYAVLNVTGAALIKYEIRYHNLYKISDYIGFLIRFRVLGGLCIIFVSALVMFKALSIGKFSYVIPITTAINYVLTVFVGHFIFGDRLSFFSVIGLSLILTGIVVMSLNKV